MARHAAVTNQRNWRAASVTLQRLALGFTVGVIITQLVGLFVPSLQGQSYANAVRTMYIYMAWANTSAVAALISARYFIAGIITAIPAGISYGMVACSDYWQPWLT